MVELRSVLPPGGSAVRSLFPILCALALLHPAALAAESTFGSVSELYSELRNSIARVGVRGEGGDVDEIETWLGTAFVIDENCTLVTAKHLFEGVESTAVGVKFVVFDGESSRSVTADPTWRALSQSNDLAFLGFPSDPKKNPCLTISLPRLRLTPRAAELLTGEEVVVLGHPKIAPEYHLDAPALRVGRIAGEGTWSFDGGPSIGMYLLDLARARGLSGGPVLRVRTGDVIGVVYGPGPTEPEYGFEWATSIYEQEETVLEVLQSVTNGLSQN